MRIIARRAALATLAMIAGMAGRVHADQIFDFRFTGEDVVTGSVVTAAGVLDAVPNGDGTFTAVGATGSITGAGVALDGPLSLIPNPSAPAPSDYNIPLGNGSYLSFTYDDQLLPGQDPSITADGLLFSLPDGAVLNIFSNGPGDYGLYEVEISVATANVPGGGSFTLAPAPEPSTLALGGLGALVGAGCWSRRRKGLATT